MAWYLKYYRHVECGVAWKDSWSCACNDRCPACGAEIEPYEWDDLTVTTAETDGKWVVSVSRHDAERSPDYVLRVFDRKQSAEEFAIGETLRLAQKVGANPLSNL
jgi:hypothetical protein